jgi:hypothetical protein
VQDRTADIEAIDAGQGKIDDDRIRRTPSRRFQRAERSFPIFTDAYFGGNVVLLKGPLDEEDVSLVILDQEKAWTRADHSVTFGLYLWVTLDRLGRTDLADCQ